MDRRRLVWITVFVTAMVSVIAAAWTFAVPQGDTAAAPSAGATGSADPPGASAPAGPSPTSDADESTTTSDSYTTLTRAPDTEDDAPPVPLAATSSVPITTATTGPTIAAPTTVPSCVDPLTDNTARCVTTTAPGPTATGGVCDTSVGRTTDPGCTGATASPTPTSIVVDPCTVTTTVGCPGTTTAPAPTMAIPTATTAAPPVTCYPVACPAASRAATP